MQDAIGIIAANSAEGVLAEYRYLERRYGKRGVGWKLETQALLEDGDRKYDELELVLQDGTHKTVYFDITSFFGKL